MARQLLRAFPSTFRLKSSLSTSKTRIDELKRYVRFSDEDARLLGAIGPALKPRFGAIAQEFYERIREHEEAHAVFADDDQVARLQTSMVRWLERVFGGAYEEEYFQKTELVGRMHVKVGLAQRYMFTAMAVIRSSLTAAIDEQAGTAAAPTGRALSLLLDIELAIMLESYRDDAIARVERAAEQHAHDAKDDRENPRTGNYVKAIELAPMLVIGLSLDGDIVAFNPGAEQTTGYARDEVLGRAFADLFVPDDHRRDYASLLLQPDGLVELALLTRTGKIRSIGWRKAHAPNPRTGEAATFLIGADVTDEELERDQQDQQRRLAAVGALAAGLAHEIRNPLNGAALHISFLERVLSKQSAPPESLEAVRVVGNEIHRLANIVTDFLEFARPRPVAYGHVEARALCARVVERIALPPGVTVATDLPMQPLAFEGDAERLEQVISNLLQNAVEALGQMGGKVALRVRREPRHARIDVEDDGPGLPDGAPIFDAFYSTKANGTGLGLAIVHRVVTDHGGSIDVDSRPGSTRFRLKLPLTRLGRREV